MFARRIGDNAGSTPLSGDVERWLGKPGEAADRQLLTAITDTSANSISPYAKYARQGAIVVPRCLFFVNEAPNPTIIQAGQTVTVDPRRGPQDKKPWNGLDLSAITGQTIETQHVHDIHLGETIVPYAALDPLKAVLPFKQSDTRFPSDSHGTGGINLGALGQRMRARWQIVSRLWENNKAPTNRLDLLGQLDYYGKLSAQLEWQRNPGDRPIRVIYAQAGEPTGALLVDRGTIVESRLYWIPCRDRREAHYVLAIINSDTLASAVNRYTTANWAGNTRDLHKHLWKLPIPRFDPANSLHVRVSRAGEAAAKGAAKRLAILRKDRGTVTVTIARRKVRKWLRDSAEGKAVEAAVQKLLAQ